MQKITEKSRKKTTLPKPPDKQGVHLVPEPPGASPASTQVSPRSQGAIPISLHWAVPPPHLPNRALGILTVKELPPSPCTGPRPLPTSQTDPWGFSLSRPPGSLSIPVDGVNAHSPPGLSLQAEPHRRQDSKHHFGFSLQRLPLNTAFRGKDSRHQGAKERRRERKRRG